MKAMVYERYGPPGVLELREVEKPVPGERDLLIKVEAASLNRSDWENLIGKPLYARIAGPIRPRTKILGTDISGVVEAVGEQVAGFAPGDEVFGDIMYHGGQGFAEYVKVPETAPLALKPSAFDHRTASTLPQAGVIALQGLGERVTEGDRVLINGAGGGTGGFAIQIAKNAGAHVTGVDNSSKQDFMREVGADQTVDFTETDYTKSGEYDLILDLVCKRSMFAIRRALAPGGQYLVVGGSTRGLLAAATVGRLLSSGGRKIGVLLVKPNKQDLSRLADLVVDGVITSHIEWTYPLDALPEAIAHLGNDLALGKLVIEAS